jgi:copper chaperone CopZ
MACAVCPVTVKKALEQVAGVQPVTIDYASKTATVQFDDTVATADQLTKATTLLVRTVGTPKRKPCRPMLAGFSTNARLAGLCSNPNQGTAACFALTARLNVRRFSSKNPVAPDKVKNQLNLRTSAAVFKTDR